jgi:mono/diheme cytochrome c family protein
MLSRARRRGLQCAALALLIPLMCVAPAAGAGASDPQDFTQVEKGRYLVTAADCTGCHTQPNGGKPFAGGRSIETPFGGILTPNITPDRDTGIGAWSDDQFDAALRKGTRPNGSRLYPAMPYTAYTKMSRDDVIAIRAYLKTVEPVKHWVVANTLPFPFNIRAAMRIWDAIYFAEGEYQADPHQTPEWNRGAFLVQGPGHCGACHTPKSFLGGDKSSEYLHGSYLQGWFAPDITNDNRRGLGRWSADDVVAYLKTGHNRISAATGPMAEEVALSSSKMADNDLKAIANYLKSLPGRSDGSSPVSANDPVMQAGAAIYRDQCSACHGLDGKGVQWLFPSLADSSVVRSDDPTTSIRIILRGARSVATKEEPTAPGMPSFGWQLNDAQVAAVITYVRNHWGTAAAAVGPDDVRRIKADIVSRPE